MREELCWTALTSFPQLSSAPRWRVRSLQTPIRGTATATEGLQPADTPQRDHHRDGGSVACRHPSEGPPPWRRQPDIAHQPTAPLLLVCTGEIAAATRLQQPFVSKQATFKNTKYIRFSILMFQRFLEDSFLPRYIGIFSRCSKSHPDSPGAVLPTLTRDRGQVSLPFPSSPHYTPSSLPQRKILLGKTQLWGGLGHTINAVQSFSTRSKCPNLTSDKVVFPQSVTKAKAALPWLCHFKPQRTSLSPARKVVQYANIKTQLVVH